MFFLRIKELIKRNIVNRNPLITHKRKCVSLQAHMPGNKENYILDEEHKASKERTFLIIFQSVIIKAYYMCFRYKVNAGITLEATLVVPIFVFSILCMIYVIVIIDIQISLQSELNTLAKEISKETYVYVEEAKKASTKDKISDVMFGLFDISVLTRIKNSKVTNIAENSFIVGGISGINIAGSNVDLTSGEGKLCISYNIKIPFISQDIFNKKCFQMVKFRTWTGIDMDNEEGADNQYVYITMSGENVYHTNKYCSYLFRNLTFITYAEAKNNAILHQCGNCGHKVIDDNEYVIVTDEGSRFHTNRDCGYLYRKIYKIKKGDSVRTECTLCARGA